MGFRDDLRLLFLLLLNGAVLAAATYAARRWTRDAVQRAVDAMLLWYVVQYTAVCVPGVLHVLTPATMAIAALLMAGGLAAWARRWPALEPSLPIAEGRIYLVFAVAVASFLVYLIYLQDWGPLLDTDAITYHAPAAVQWLQTRRLGLFPTWFFNPANTFSPLAGSTFIAWALAPLGGDTLARYVQLPAIFLAFLAALQIARALGANPWAAATLAAAAACSRLCTSEIVNPRDDMFLAAIVGVAVAGCARERLGERFGAARVGLALGLALATKYTALLSLPLLLVMADAPFKAGWTRRQWLTAAGAVVLIAGPWYLRNLLLTGNPLYPLEVRLFGHTLLPGLFVVERSERLRTLHGIYDIFIEGYHGLPAALAIVAAVAWLGAIAGSIRSWREPLVRGCVAGPLICVALFLIKAPYGEVRFLFPAMLVAMGSLALIGRLNRRWGGHVMTVVAGLVLAASIYTSYRDAELRGEALAACVTVTALMAGWLWLDARLGYSRRARTYAAAGLMFVFLGYAYVYWSPYVGTVEYHTPEFWNQEEFYPDLAAGWLHVRQNVPADATVAYSQTFLVYPLYGPALQRRAVYVPVRADVPDVLHLPHFPKPLPGEQINDAFTDLLNASADRDVWLRRLKEARAQYLFIYLAGRDRDPWEERFARANPAFAEVFRDPNVVIYQIRQ